jgi:aminopeptidase-like protein
MTEKNKIDFPETGQEMYNLMKELFPICRSITGDGVRDTLKIIKKSIPLKINEVPSGTQVFDWMIPKEWNIRDAYIKNSAGKKIVAFKKSNLHVVSYSSPVSKKISLDELKKHLHTLEKYPDWIPYLTSYYNENWGFCMTHNEFEALKEGKYEVFIDSTLKEGSLTYGEFFIKGECDKEILLTSYLCHPSLCNDNLSGIVLLTFLAKYLKGKKLKYSYRFLFIPETIGSITWLSLNEKTVSKIKFGLVITCVGDRGISTYKKTRQGNNILDKIAEKVLTDTEEPYKIIDFFPWGSDERQFSSPGFNIPIGLLMRTPYGQFPEYHTSADNLDFISSNHLSNSLRKYLDIIYIIETDVKFENLNPKCEPHLRKKGLSRISGGQKDPDLTLLAKFWLLNLSDCTNSLLDISIRSKIHYKKIKKSADLLQECGLLKLIEK